MSAPKQPELGFGSTDSSKKPDRPAESSHLSLVAEASPSPRARRSRIGSKLARAVIGDRKPADEPDETGEPRRSSVGHFEKLAVSRLDRYLSGPDTRPFFSPPERDVMIHNPKAYFNSIRKYVQPAADDSESLASRRNRADVQARKGRTRAYGERLIESLASVDNCRSWRWYLLDGQLRPVHADDSPRSIQRRVAVDLTDLLTEARLRGLLAGGHSGKVIDSLKSKFASVDSWMAGDGRTAEEIDLAVWLTVLVGKNAVLKANEWRGRFWNISKGYTILDPELLDIFEQFNNLRPASHREHFDPLAGFLTDLKAKQLTQGS